MRTMMQRAAIARAKNRRALAMPEEERQCARKVGPFTREMVGRWNVCGQPGVVMSGGRWFCEAHTEAYAAKRAARDVHPCSRMVMTDEGWERCGVAATILVWGRWYCTEHRADYLAARRRQSVARKN